MIRVDKKKLIPVLSCSLNKVNNDSGYDVDNNFCTTTMIMTFSVYYRKIPKNKPLQVEARQSNIIPWGIILGPPVTLIKTKINVGWMYDKRTHDSAVQSTCRLSSLHMGMCGVSFLSYDCDYDVV